MSDRFPQGHEPVRVVMVYGWDGKVRVMVSFPVDARREWERFEVRQMMDPAVMGVHGATEGGF